MSMNLKKTIFLFIVLGLLLTSGYTYAAEKIEKSSIRSISVVARFGQTVTIIIPDLIEKHQIGYLFHNNNNKPNYKIEIEPNLFSPITEMKLTPLKKKADMTIVVTAGGMQFFAFYISADENYKYYDTVKVEYDRKKEDE